MSSWRVSSEEEEIKYVSDVRLKEGDFILEQFLGGKRSITKGS